VSDIVSKRKGTTPNAYFMNNLFCLLEQISLPEPLMSSIVPPQLLCSIQGDTEDVTKPDKKSKKKSEVAYMAAQRNIDTIWMEVIRYPLSLEHYRSSLVHIPDKVMPHLKQPTLLCFLYGVV